MASVETTKDADAVADRERSKAEWLDSLAVLVDAVEGWSRELGWSTRRIEKTLDDSEIGPYQAPALIMQEETTRALLDPIGRSTPGSDGVVDLYLMPAFDDIARYHVRNGRVNRLGTLSWAVRVGLNAENSRSRVETKPSPDGCLRIKMIDGTMPSADNSGRRTLERDGGRIPKAKAFDILGFAYDRSCGETWNLPSITWEELDMPR